MEQKSSYRNMMGPLLLIALGVIFLMSNLGIVSGDFWDYLTRFWPVLLIITGLDSLIRKQGVVSPSFLIVLGCIFLISNFGFLKLNTWGVIFRLWPLLLVALGLDILVGRRSTWGAIASVVLILALLAGALWFSGLMVDSATLINSHQYTLW